MSSADRQPADAGAAVAGAVRDDPAGSAKYTTRAYWDKRFASETRYEWLAGYDSIADLISQYIGRSARVLLLGNGSSRLPLDMAAAGYARVVATDYSVPAVRNGRAAAAAAGATVRWAVADMLALAAAPGERGAGADDADVDSDAPVRFAPASFDAVVDKAAMDAILADGGDCWAPTSRLLDAARDVMDGVARVLRPGGVFLQLSFSQPHFRWRYLATGAWAGAQAAPAIVPGDVPGGEPGRSHFDENVDTPAARGAPDDDDEWEPDRGPPAGALGPDRPELAAISSPASPWATAARHDVHEGFGYFMYVMKRKSRVLDERQNAPEALEDGGANAVWGSGGDAYADESAGAVTGPPTLVEVAALPSPPPLEALLGATGVAAAADAAADGFEGDAEAAAALAAAFALLRAPARGPAGWAPLAAAAWAAAGRGPPGTPAPPPGAPPPPGLGEWLEGHARGGGPAFPGPLRASARPELLAVEWLGVWPAEGAAAAAEATTTTTRA